MKMCVVIHPDIWKWIKPHYERWGRREGVMGSEACVPQVEANKGNWPDPTPEMLTSPEFNAVWNVIRTWDINVPEVDGELYTHATGNHVRAILDALLQLPIPGPGKEGEKLGTLGPTKWKYTALYEHSFPADKLNEAGAHGWELVAVMGGIVEGSIRGADVYILKRPVLWESLILDPNIGREE